MELSIQESEWGQSSMKASEYKIPKEKFALVNENRRIKDKELATKPIGYFRDAFNRFARNKGSLVAACVIGVLFLYAIFAPIFSPYYVSYTDIYFRGTLPKLFTSEKVDFLDGCSNKSLNEQAFLYYYAMGEETGHNAIKRQEYTVSGDAESGKLYNFRLDSYQQTGAVFVSMSLDRYHDIQEYQDKNDVQIIYPITDLEKRPTSFAQVTDANYWFETKEIPGKKTEAINYTINEDGSVTFKNIYVPYTADELSTKTAFNSAKKVQIFEKDGGYAIGFINSEGAEDPVEYILIECENGTDDAYVTLTGNIENANVFTYNTTHKTFITEVTGHENSALDGNYFFGISSDAGSGIKIISETELGSASNIPMHLYVDQNNYTDSPAVGTDYVIAFARSKDVVSLAGLGNYSTINKEFAASSAVSTSFKASFVDNGSGGLVMTVKAGAATKYVTVSPDGAAAKISVANDVADGSVWVFDATNKSIKTAVTGFGDASLDGDYYFTVNTEGNSVAAAKLETIENDSALVLLNLYVSSTDFATSLATGTQYFLINKQVSKETTCYYADGQFSGDNYHSKMRIEGDTPLYSYGRPIQDGIEVRVNYYEYYCFMHTQVIKDGIKTPFFLFGTNDSGKDIFTCLASGARFSFALAIIVELVNMIVGAIYGAIEGYYGGKIDLVMERIVEILSAVPFMIVITLLRYHMGSSPQVLILFIAFFLTGWIGMSGTVRMQFYRFKNQEYVLAARTLGARDWRIMFKHIFPNALGTIVTSCVLVIPGMIFSETSLSYLGIINLESGNLTSVGTLLAAGQPYLISSPHMILFPSIFISLLMLSFNLFGNGLRDAFNPSLRGTED